MPFACFLMHGMARNTKMIIRQMAVIPPRMEAATVDEESLDSRNSLPCAVWTLIGHLMSSGPRLANLKSSSHRDSFASGHSSRDLLYHLLLSWHRELCLNNETGVFLKTELQTIACC
eukprot:scpid103324/ scgid11268/ 